MKNSKFSLNYCLNFFELPNPFIKNKKLIINFNSFLLNYFNIKIFISILSFSLILTSNLQSQSWKFVGGPKEEISYDVIFTNSGRLICSAQKGIFVSDDLGNSWTQSKFTGVYKGIYKFTERKNGNIIAVAGNGIVVSYDEGESWNIIYENYSINTDIYVCESPINYALYFVAGNSIFKSTDDGFNWDIVFSSNYLIYSCAIDNSGRIFLGYEKGLITSNDDGLSFYPYKLGEYVVSGSGVKNIHISSSGSLFFEVNNFNHIIIATYDEGGTVNSITADKNGGILAITLNNEMIYSSGSCLYLYNQFTKDSRWLSCPYFLDGQFSKKIITFDNHWIGNFNRYGLYYSSNGGTSWDEISNEGNYKYCLSLEILNDNKIFVSTFNGLYQSIDDGSRWKRKEPEILDSYFYDINKLQNGGLIAYGPYGSFIANDANSYWIQLTDLSNVDAQFISKKGVIYTNNGINGIYKSYDNGMSWIESNGNLSPGSIYSFGEGINNRIFVATASQGMYFSDDEGLNWIKIYSSNISNRKVYCFSFYSDTVYAGTDQGVYFSTDNGINWQILIHTYVSVKKLLSAPNGDLISLTNKTIYLYSRHHRIWKPFNFDMEDRIITDLVFDKYYRLFVTTDLGLYRNDYYISNSLSLFPEDNSLISSHKLQFNWSVHPFANSYHLQISTDSTFSNLAVNVDSITDTFMVVESLRYASTYYWRIKANLDINSDFSEIYKFQILNPNSFILRQNYPNPFNASTNIIFDIPVKSRIKINVYNILGELIQTLTENEFEPGSYIIIWNAENLSSGIYVMVLETSGLFITNKAVLIK